MMRKMRRGVNADRVSLNLLKRDNQNGRRPSSLTQIANLAIVSRHGGPTDEYTIEHGAQVRC